MEVHRCRFVPFQPSAINALAFSHPRTRSSKHSANARLAIGRANGDIEIWNPANGTWHQELIIRGGKDRSVDGLVWVTEPDQDLGDGKVLLGKSRLFSIGYTSTITEWDLERAAPKRHASGQHGDIWCLAAQPPNVIDDQLSNGAVQDYQGPNKLVAGTIDGELVVYDIEDDDLRFQRVVVRSPTKKAQMVSITFQSRNIAVVGCSDSTIRVYDIRKGAMLRRMALGADLAGGSKDIIVWSVKCLARGNIVSGDSTGQVCIWDGKTYTQTQKLQGHKADVLSLATSSDGKTIFSGGMDRRTVLYRQETGPNGRWSKVWGRRYHSHDVKAMASFESGRVSVIVSGGPDSNLVVIPLKDAGRYNHRTLSNLPQENQIACASRARFIVSWWDREVHIWLIRKSAAELNSGASNGDLNNNRKLLKTVVIKGDSNITSAAIDDQGRLLVVSTSTDVKAFWLRHNAPEKPSDVKLATVQLPKGVTRLGATRLQLSRDMKWLCVVQQSARVLMVRLDLDILSDGDVSLHTHEQKLSRVHRTIPRYVRNGGLRAYDRTITHITFTADSRMVAVADLAGFIDTWTLPNPENLLHNGNNSDSDDAASSSSVSSSDSDSSDEEGGSSDGSSGERWVRNPKARLLPKLPSAPVILAFSDDEPQSEESPGPFKGIGTGQYTLLAITASWNLLTFHPSQGSLTSWSRRNPSTSLPGPVRDLLDLAKGAIFQNSRIWVYGVSFLFMLDLAQDMTLQEPVGGIAGQQQPHGTKRKRAGPTPIAGGKMAQGNLVPEKVYVHKGDEVEEEDVDMDAASLDDEDTSAQDEDGDDVDGELAQLRNRDVKESKSLELSGKGTEPKKWWMTYKYRPIMGVVPVQWPGHGMEFAIVERPTWDVETPQRYFAGEEWEK